MVGDQVLRDQLTIDEMLADNSLENRGIAVVIPRAFGIDDGDRSTLADAKTIRLGPQHAAPIRQAQLFQPSLQKPPGFIAPFAVAAFRLRLIAAEEDVPSGA